MVLTQLYACYADFMCTGSLESREIRDSLLQPCGTFQHITQVFDQYSLLRVYARPCRQTWPSNEANCDDGSFDQ